MDYLGLGISALSVRENNAVLRAIPIVIGVLFALIILAIIFFYFKNIELKRDYEKNKEKIQKNYEMIEKFKKNFYKVGVVIFIILGFTIIIASNFIELF